MMNRDRSRLEMCLFIDDIIIGILGFIVEVCHIIKNDIGFPIHFLDSHIFLNFSEVFYSDKWQTREVSTTILIC